MPQHGSAPVRYFVWDGERTWIEGAELYMEYDEYLDRPNLVKPLLEALMTNPDFRKTLAHRMQQHLFNNGPLTDANAQIRWQQLNNAVELAIVAESARWGVSMTHPPRNKYDWQNALANEVNNFFPNRSQVVVNQLNNTTLYGSGALPASDRRSPRCPLR